MKSVGKPDALIGHVRFDERGRETGRRRKAKPPRPSSTLPATSEPPRDYLRFVGSRLRTRTPGPPPFSAMNSTPAISKACRIAKSFAAVREV